MKRHRPRPASRAPSGRRRAPGSRARPRATRLRGRCGRDPTMPTVWSPISPRTVPPTIGLQDHDPSRNDVAMSNRRWRQASIIMIANSPSAGSWPYALHSVTPLGSAATSMPSVPASGTCSKRNFGAAGNPLRQAPVCNTSASASAGSRLCRFVVIKDFGTDVGSDEFNDWPSLRGGECTQEQRFHWRLILQRRQVRVVITRPHTYPATHGEICP
jgi:hypothetical protein